FLQSVLYLYHLWVFFITSVLFFVISFNRKKLTVFIYFICVISLLSCSIIILQNFDLIPYLWSNVYKSAYVGFFSGTLGPNKIVTGMFSLMVAIFAIGLLSN